MNVQKIIVLLCAFVGAGFANAQSDDSYSTRPWQNDIRSLQVLKNNAWGGLPILDFGSSDYIVVSFDRINTSAPERFRYKLVHCNSDWTPGGLLDMEFLDGFNDNLVDDYANSQSTTVEYVNYRIQVPNSNLSIKLSGNYVLLVYEEDKPSHIVLSACFYVSDNRLSVASAVSSNTDMGVNKEYQQVAFFIDPLRLNINDPYTDIKTVVMQNRRGDNLKKDLKPTFLNNGRLIYEHNPKLIFDAGNEYRRFEYVSVHSGGMNVEHSDYENRHYRAWLFPDRIRAGKSYLYDQDQDGRFLIRNYDGTDPDVDADYVLVNFSLKADSPFGQPVYLFGDLTYGQFDDSWRMNYNEAQGEYQLQVLLKQGSYNYMYMTRNGGEASTQAVEGNYYQTENEYLTLVYYRPVGQRYDSLSGYSAVR